MGLNTNELIVILLIIGTASLGMFFPKSKGVFYYEFVILTLLIALHDSLGSDLFFYSHEYDAGRLSDSIFEKGYEFLGILFKNAGVSFEAFHIIIAAVSMYVFAYVIKKISPRPAFCMSLMYGFSTFEYAYQLKALTASAVIVYAVYYYFKDVRDRKRILVYIGLVLLAAEFHFFGILFLPVVMASFKNQKLIRKIVLILTIAVSVFLVPLVNIARRMIPALASYSVGLSPKTVILSAAWHVSGIIIMKWINDSMQKKAGGPFLKVPDSLSQEKAVFIENIYRGAYALLLTVPFYYYTNVMSRVVRTWCVFYIAAISNINGGIRFVNRKAGLRILMIIYIWFSFLAFYVWFTHNKLLVKSFIDGNMLLRFFL